MRWRAQAGIGGEAGPVAGWPVADTRPRASLTGGCWGSVPIMRIGLFVTCLTDTLFPDTGKAVVALLERLGHQVEFPAGQSCCG